MSAFRPCGVVTVTTDFGHKGPFVGTMKGQILRRFADARILDLTHDVYVHWPAEAGFWVQRAYPYFPAGTVHVAVVDPGVGTARDILCVQCDEHVMLAPDNGLLAPLADKPGSTVWRVDQPILDTLGITAPSATFHGRDIFAPLAAELAAGRCQPDELGKVVTRWVPSHLDEPDVSPERVRGVVVTVDHFGNLITNIDATLLESLAQPVVHAGGRDFVMGRTYGDVSPGGYLALVNSFGVLEIARAENSAADGLGLERGAPVTVRSA